MAFKIAVFTLLLAVASADPTSNVTESYDAQESAVQIEVATSEETKVPSATKLTGPIVVESADHHHRPQYSYAYDVQDELTGDNKQHQESRKGDVVKGSYSLVEADGSRRTVHYTADPVRGFNAVVDKERQKPVAAPVVSKVVPGLVSKVVPDKVAVGSLVQPLVHQIEDGYSYVPYPVTYNHYSGPYYSQSISEPTVPVPYVTKVPAPVAYPSNYGHPVVYNYASPVYAHQPAPVAYAHYNAPIVNKVAPVTYQNYHPTLARIAAPVAYSSYAAPYGYSYH